MQTVSVLLIIVVAVVLVILLMALEHFRQWDCPKCGQTMHKTGKKGGFMWRNVEMHCTSCGHTKWHEPPCHGGGGCGGGG